MIKNVAFHLLTFCTQFVKVQWSYNTSNQTCSNIWKFTKKRNQIREPSKPYSHIWHIDILNCWYQLYTQSVKVWWRHNTPEMNICYLCEKIHKKRNIIKEHQSCYSLKQDLTLIAVHHKSYSWNPIYLHVGMHLFIRSFHIKRDWFSYEKFNNQ